MNFCPFAVKSWEDQVAGALNRCHREIGSITRDFKKQGFGLVFFCFPTKGVRRGRLAEFRNDAWDAVDG
jgi:hypothetical protein